MIQQFISKLSANEKKILALTAFVLLLVFVDRFFFGPALEHLKSLQEDIQDKENSLKRYLRFLSYRDQISKEQNILEKYYTEKQLTPGEIKEIFLNKIEMLAHAANISSIRVTPSEGEKKKDYTEYFANLECMGKLKDILTFMHAIDTSEELMKVGKLNMSAKKVGSDEITVSMTVSKIIVESEMIEKNEKPVMLKPNFSESEGGK